MTVSSAHQQIAPLGQRNSVVRSATPSSVRQVNKSIILKLIRAHEPCSRAELSLNTGITRTNVSQIVEECIEDGLVEEQRAVPSGRGRVPFHLHIKDDGYWVLGVSIRSTETTVALAGLTGHIQGTVVFETPDSPEALVRELEKACARLRKAHLSSGETLREIGVSLPGLVHTDRGEVMWAPSLPGYSGCALAEQISQRTGLPTSIDNDCNLAALAELWLDEKEAAGLSDFVLLEIGDVGVGAGIILNRELYRGHDSSFAAEFGHMVVDPEGPHCRCGRRGCLELYVCDRATWRSYSPNSQFSASGFATLCQLARRRDARALAVFEETARYLSIGVSNIVLALNPAAIVLAGQITKVWEQIAPIVESAFAGSTVRTRLRPARLEPNDLFLHGALSLVLGKVFAGPRLGP